MSALQGLGQLSQLTRLEITFGSKHVTKAQINSLVQPLAQLRQLHFEFSGAALTDGFPLGITSSCRRLCTLRISGGGHLQLGPLSPAISTLSGLTRIHIANAGVTSVSNSLSRLTALEEIVLCHNEGLTDLPEGFWAPTGLTSISLAHTGISSLSESISQLSALQELYVGLTDLELALPQGLTACQQLTCLAMGSDRASPVLAGLHSLRRLTVDSLADQQPQVTYWTQLTRCNRADASVRWGALYPRGAGGHVQSLPLDHRRRCSCRPAFGTILEPPGDSVHTRQHLPRRGSGELGRSGVSV